VTSRLTALESLLPSLVCPVCTGALQLRGSVVGCAEGHAFDVARQGYLNLLTGSGGATADTSAMVEARARHLAAGHYRPLADAVAGVVTEVVGPARGHDPSPRGRRESGAGGTGPLIVDLAAGTGYYLAAVLDALDEVTGAIGLAVDVSRPALKRAASAHPQAGAVGADAWGRLPIAAGTATAVLSVFGPRRPAEMARILRPGGVIVVLTPRPRHLEELADPLGLLGIEPDKEQRVDRTFAAVAAPGGTREITYTASLSRPDALDVATMGPTAHHVAAEELARRAATLPDRLDVTVSARLAWYRVG
jgi:23S rRNA (guanine745-N1)-methyltransferase